MSIKKVDCRLFEVFKKTYKGKMSIQDFCNTVGISRSLFYACGYGHAYFSIKTLQIICLDLGCKASDIYPDLDGTKVN